MQSAVEKLPPSLFKYSSVSGRDGFRHLQSLLHFGDFYFSRPESFNDPFDCLPVYSVEAPDEEIRARWSERYADDPETLDRMLRLIPVRTLRPDVWTKCVDEMKRDLLNDIRQNVGVSCFSSVNNDILMWSHYADHHRGICLVFNRADGNRVFKNAIRVLYTQQRPVLNLIRDDKKMAMEKALCTKAVHWQYEHEWRWLYQVPGVHRFELEMLAGIILGAKISEDHKHRVLTMVRTRRLPLEVYQAEIDSARFELQIRPA
jgi:hypothetical protein